MAYGNSNSTVAGLLAEYQRELPLHPVYNLVDVKECTKFELEKYTSGHEDPSTTQIVYSNFLQHLLHYHTKLDMAAKSIYTEHALGVTQRLYEDFDKPSPLKEYISAEVEWNVEENSNSYHSNQHWRKLFSKEEAGIQSMLEPSSFDSQNLKAWDPIYLTLSYELFCLVINAVVMESDEYDDKSILYKKNRHEGTYKRKYILYMNEVANSDMEFLLAVVSAFGINQSKYPSKLLLILLKRKLLLEYYNNQVTEEDLNEVTNYLSTVIPTNSFQHESLCVTPALETPTVATSSIATIGSEVNNTRAMTPLVPTATVSSSSSSKSVEKANTISADEFFMYGTVVWNQFYGHSNSKPIPSKWYDTFASQFPDPNNTKDVLSSCIQQLLLDQKNTQNLSNDWRIVRIVDFNAEQLQLIEKNLCQVTKTIPKYFDERNGYAEIMRMNNSLLQMGLINSNRKNNNFIPKPTEWCPSNCILPFHGFQQHINWVLSQQGLIGGLDHLNINIMRLRYAEYLFRTRYGEQLVLGLFTAFGPNLLDYPIRVLVLLKELNYLKPNTMLVDKMGEGTNGIGVHYCNILVGNIPIGKGEIVGKTSSLPMEPQRPMSSASSTASLKSEASSFKSDLLENYSRTTPSPTHSSASVASSTVRTKNTVPVCTNYLLVENSRTISEEEFFNAATECWNLFYGNTSQSKPMQRDWYLNFASQFPNPNNDNGILDECIKQLLRDKNTRQHPYYRVIRIVDEFPDKLKPIENDMLNLMKKSGVRTLTGEENEGYDFLMRHKKSFLQHAIVDPDMSALRKTLSVPELNEWCPSGSILPFHGFKHHANWYLTKNRRNVLFDEVDVDVMRVRYVEYLNILYRNPRQFILGLFTAYGPNILNYPLRVLLILKKRNLLKSNTMLYTFINMRCDTKHMYAFNILYYTNRRDISLPKDSQNSRFTSNDGSLDNGPLTQLIGNKSIAKPISSKPVDKWIQNKLLKTGNSNNSTATTPSTPQNQNKDFPDLRWNLPNGSVETFPLLGNSSIPPLLGSTSVGQLTEDVYLENGYLNQASGSFKVSSSMSTNNTMSNVFEPRSANQHTEVRTKANTRERGNESGTIASREVDLGATFSGTQSTTIGQPMRERLTMTNATPESEDFRKWEQACQALLNYGNSESSDLQIPEQFYSAVYTDYEKLRLAINANNDQNVFHLFIHGALTGVQLSEFHQTPSYSRDSAVVGHAFQASLPSDQSEGFTLEEDSRMLLSQFFPNTTIYPFLNSFNDAKRKEEHVIDKILEIFPGDKIEDFVRELSYHACFITNVEDIRFCTTLLQEFIRRDIISKAYVIHSFKTGVIQKLPELCAKVVQATFRLAEFLVEIFYDENDFCWFLTMTGGMSKIYLPVWVDLLKTTVNLLKRRVSDETVAKLLCRTPGAVAFTKYMRI